MVPKAQQLVWEIGISMCICVESSSYVDFKAFVPVCISKAGQKLCFDVHIFKLDPYFYHGNSCVKEKKHFLVIHCVVATSIE